ncbi:uncharacterized protein B0I36DRAFT_314436 [Microdochium trichocladiopsis]|uniref:Uncharacterized protein n=1 Tax=Microdochium trichocladiopsis TaxID=1682393 RepID=A0A9P8YGN9_9PEZI|nr:uncharacterized protein B0I36DRAFT_314436 [Microdochium trichocladiopsis]KAH7037613.1 hypothetical protein B0I36DRAFT_314436 [Microdochium trichocladiopsis]
MHRRRSLAQSDVARTQSNRSSRGVQLQHVDPDKAKLHAHAAASRAFTRARERASTEPSVWPPPRTGNSTPQSIVSRNPANAARSPGRELRRRDSVRFCRSRSPTSRRTQGIEGLAHPAHTEFRHGTSHSRATDFRQAISPSRASADGMISATKGAAGDYINNLIVGGQEYYTPEDDIASLPSSFRRIRKSKSMFAASGHHRYGPDTAQDIVTTSQSQSWLRGVGTSHGPGRNSAVKSISYLKSRQHHSEPVSTYHSVRMYQEDTVAALPAKSRTLRSHSSTLFGARTSQTSKLFSKTMRIMGAERQCSTRKLKPDDNVGLKSKARKVSLQVKRGIKNIFSINKADDDDDILPPQHIEAKSSPAVSPARSASEASILFHLDAADVDCSISQVASGVPSLHAVSSLQELQSRHGSVESLESDSKASEEKSRVTSWTNSDSYAHSTVASNRSDHGRQRLSVINEHGLHVSSSSTRPELGSARGDVKPTDPASTPKASRVVDGPRLFSALMKRLDDASPTKHDYQSEGDGPRPPPIQSLPSGHESPVASLQDAATSKASPATIRRVSTADGAALEARLPPAAPAVTKETAFAEEVVTTAVVPTLNASRSAPLDNNIVLSSQSNGANPLAGERRDDQRFRTLSSRSSAFFGSPTCHLFRTKSPYRKALQASIRTAHGAPEQKSPEYNPWMRSLTDLSFRCPSADSEPDRKMRDTDSIYSETPDDKPRGRVNIMSIVDKFPKPPITHGDATIFVSSPTPMPLRGRRAPERLSSEWKNWLSTNVSKLEGAEESLIATLSDNFGSPIVQGACHVREQAQIDNDDPIDDGSYEGALLFGQSDGQIHAGHAKQAGIADGASHATFKTVTEIQDPPAMEEAHEAIRRLDSGSVSSRRLLSTPQMPQGTVMPMEHTSIAATSPRGLRDASNHARDIKECASRNLSAATGGRAELGSSVDRQFGILLASDRQKNANRGTADVFMKSKHLQGSPSRTLSSANRENEAPRNLDENVPASHEADIMRSILQARRHRLASSDDDGSVFL